MDSKQAICLVMVFASKAQSHSSKIIRGHLDSNWQINKELLHLADSNIKTGVVNDFELRSKYVLSRTGGVIIKRDLNKLTEFNNDNSGRDRGADTAGSAETETFNKHFKMHLEENQTKTLYNLKEEQLNKHNKNNEFKTNNRQQKLIDMADKNNELAADEKVDMKDSSHTNVGTRSDTSSSNNSNSDSSRYNTQNLTGFVLNSSLDDKRKSISGSPSALSYIDTTHSNISSNSDSKRQNVPITTVVAETSTNESSQIMNDQPQEVNANRDDRILYTNTTGAEDDMVELITKNTKDVWNVTDDYNDTDPSAADRTMSVQSGFSVDVAAITGICLAVVVVVGLIGAGSFVFYRRQYWNKPQTLSDKCSNADSSGYIDDSTLRENSEEMYSLDNDSFLNSLEAMTIQNYWTDNVKHTKL